MSDIFKKQRPLSPHLQVYKPQMTSVMSIMHRFAGIALSVGSLLLVWLLLAAATGPEAYNIFMVFAGSLLGQFMLFGWTLALYFHLCNGIRHLFWDVGYLFDLKNAYRAGYLVLAATYILTIGTWYCVLYH